MFRLTSGTPNCSHAESVALGLRDRRFSMRTCTFTKWVCPMSLRGSVTPVEKLGPLFPKVYHRGWFTRSERKFCLSLLLVVIYHELSIVFFPSPKLFVAHLLSPFNTAHFSIFFHFFRFQSTTEISPAFPLPFSSAPFLHLLLGLIGLCRLAVLS